MRDRQKVQRSLRRWVSVCGLLGCLVPVAQGAWPTYHGAPSLTGTSAVSITGKPELAWRYTSGGRIDSTPISDGKRIFVSMGRGRIVAMGLTGEKHWEKTFTRINDAGQEMNVRFEAPLVCSGEMVFAGSTRGTLFALDAVTGEEAWRYETGGTIIGSPNMIFNGLKGAKEPGDAYSGVVVLDQSEGALHGVDILSGKQVWKTDGVERCDGAPSVNAYYITFGSCLAKLHVYSHDGVHLRDIEVGGDAQIAGGVALDGKLAFAGVRDGGLLCFNLETGEVVWSSDESEDQTFSTPAVTESLVIYSSDNGFVYGVKKASGVKVWAYDTGGIPYSPVVAGDQVAVSADGILYLLNLENGQMIWSKEISDEITSPALINGMVVVGADDGSVSALRSSDS